MGKLLFPDCLDRENAPMHPGATRIWQGMLVMAGINSRQAHDGVWGDQTDVTTAMLQNELGVSETRKLDAPTRAALLAHYKINLSFYVVEEFLPATAPPADAIRA